MAADIDPGDLRFLLADLAAKADAGDEAAALRLNELTGRCTPTVARAAADLAAVQAKRAQPTLGEILAEALSSTGALVQDDPWTLISAAVDLIAQHYLLEPDEVWTVVFELEREWAEKHGVETFGRLLEGRSGFAMLGLYVARILLGDEAADRLPRLWLSCH